MTIVCPENKIPISIPMQTPRNSRRIAAFAMLAVSSSSVMAATVTKNDTATMQANATDWSAAPAAADIGSFNGTLSETNAAALTLGGPLTIGNLTFTNELSGPVTITDTNTLTLGNGVAITATAANQDITFNCPITINTAGNTFEANNNLLTSLTFNSPISSTQQIVWRAGNATFSGGGSYPSITINSRGTTISTLKLGANNGLCTTANLIVGGANGHGRFDLAGFNQTISGLTKGSGNSGTIANSSTTDSTLTVTGSTTYSGVIQDSFNGGTGKLALVIDGGTPFVLSGTCTHTGGTTIQSGTLNLADNAILKFVTGTASEEVSKITGAGLFFADGDFQIDTTLTEASPLTSGTWTLVGDPMQEDTFGPTFRVITGNTAWTQNGTVWTKTASGKTFSFDTTTAILTLSQTGYDAWVSERGLTGSDALFESDPDQDGIDNGLEFVLGGEPNPANAGSNSTPLLPTVAHSAGDLVFSFKREDLSESSATLHFQWSTDLTFPSPANDVPIGTVDSTTDTITVDVTEDDPDADTDTIVITVPAAKAAGGKLFGRLKAAKNP